MSERVDGRTFDEWLAEVDRILIRMVGLSSADLADAPYRDSFHDEVSPAEMVSVIAEWDEVLAGFLAEVGGVA